MTDDKTPEQAKLDEILDKLAAINERLDRIEAMHQAALINSTLSSKTSVFPTLGRLKAAADAALRTLSGGDGCGTTATPPPHDGKLWTPTDRESF